MNVMRRRNIYVDAPNGLGKGSLPCWQRIIREAAFLQIMAWSNLDFDNHFVRLEGKLTGF